MATPDTEPQLPSVTDSDFTERDGVNAVAVAVNRARMIWRETVLRDVGIDGQIEHVNAFGQATGSMVFVQIKSGASYFAAETEADVPNYPSERHRAYWERVLLPVILVLHDPRDHRTFWVDARDAIRRGEHPIRVPKVNVFDAAGVTSAMGPVPNKPLTLPSLALQMTHHKHDAQGFPLDFFDLFAHGLTNLCQSVYFGMDLVMNVVEAKLTLDPDGPGWSLGAAEYDFLLDYVRFLVQQDLARIDFDDFWRQWQHRQLVGAFLAPLTARGASLVNYLGQLEGPDRGRELRAIQDKAFAGIAAFETARRVGLTERLKTVLERIED